METEIHLQRCTVALLIPAEISEKTNKHVIGAVKHYIHAVDCVVIKNTGPKGYLLSWVNVCDVTKEMSIKLKVHAK